MKHKGSLLGKLTPRESFSPRDSYRNRQILLNKITNYWLKGVLEKSLAAGRHPLPPGTEVVEERSAGKHP